MNAEAEKLLSYLNDKALKTKRRSWYFRTEELKEESGIEDLAEALRPLENEGLIYIYRKTPYGADVFQIGLKGNTTDDDVNGHPPLITHEISEGTRVGAPCPDPPSTLKAELGKDEGLDYHQPPRLHKRTLTSIGRLNPIATGCLRRLCKLKGNDDQWWTGYLEHGKYRVSKYGKLVLHPEDNENYGRIVDEIADILHKYEIDPTITLEGFTRSAHYGYSISGVKLDKVKAGKVRFEINSKYEITLNFDKSEGKVLEGEHLVNIKSLGEPEADKELTRMFSNRAYAYAFVKEFTDKVDYVYNAIKAKEKSKKVNRKNKRIRRKPLLELKVYKPSLTRARIYNGLRLIFLILYFIIMVEVLVLTWGYPLYGL